MKLNVQLLNRKKTWIEIFILALGIAVLIAAWPAARCAVADCSAQDRWCAADCSMECYSVRRVREVSTPGYVLFDAYNRPFCTEPTWVWNNYSCTAPPTLCGDTITVKDQGLPPLPALYQPCGLRYVSNSFTCCRPATGNPTPTPGACTPEYDPPTLTLTSVTPPYPLTLGQDPASEGFDVLISAQGGQKTNACDGPENATLTALALESVTLSPASITWIEDELASYYPGAAVLDSYPLAIAGNVTLNGTTGILSFHVDPLDPGTYVLEVEATQDSASNDTTTATFEVKVYLLESTLTMPGNEW